jgi:hypothetical protein
MKNSIILFMSILFICSFAAQGQEGTATKKIKAITEFNNDNKKKELDHITNLNEAGLKTEEIEYYSDGVVKAKTDYEYDTNFCGGINCYYF